METCVTLGMLKEGQADELKAAGLDYYNHNLDTGTEHYVKVVTTHSQGRFDTLDKVRDAGIKCLLRRHRRHGRDPPRRADRCW
jgi:biotin synthase